MASVCGSRNINRISIDYAFRPRLRDRLTLSRLTLTQETLGLRREWFSPSLSLLMPTKSFPIAPTTLSVSLHSYGMLSYHVKGTSKASVLGLSPVELSVQSCLTSELLRFL